MSDSITRKEQYLAYIAGKSNTYPITPITREEMFLAEIAKRISSGSSEVSGGVGILKIEKTSTNGLVDTYTITYTDNTKSTFTVTNGKDGLTPYIGDNDDWWIGETDTGVKAEGKDGINGIDGKTPYIQDGYWYIDGVNTNVKAQGDKGDKGDKGDTYTLTDADKAEIAEIVSKLGTPEIVISFNENGYWWNHKGVPEFYVPSDGNACSKETNYIEATEGDVFRVTTRTSDGHCANGAWYDANKDLISSILVEGDQSDAKTVELTAPKGTAYARFFSMAWTSSAVSDKVPFNVEYMGKAGTESKTASPLKGKKIVYDGDSICSSWGTSRNGGSYPKIIADIVEGEYDNQGVGGGRIVTQEGSTDTFHSIVDNIVNLPTDGDLYCFEGGVNDHWHGVPLGTFSESDYTGELDKTTFCGALETIFRYAITHFVGKPICYIITHKCPTSAFTSGYFGSSDTFADFRQKALGICEKYSIPVYDAWKDSGINSWNASQLANYFILSESTGTGDGTHPNEQGYRRYYVPQLIKLFEKIMPIGATEPEQPEQPETPTYTNLLDEAGWTNGVYLLDGVEKPDDNASSTGYLPVVDKGTIYLKNVTIPKELGHGHRINFFREDKSFIGALTFTTGDTNEQDAKYDANGNLVQFYFHVNDTRFIRLSAWHIDETSIITYNEPID